METERPRPGKIDSALIPNTTPDYPGIHTTDYLSAFVKTVQEMYEQQAVSLNEVADAFYESWRAGGRIILMGNGGSAAVASHAGADMRKRTRVDGMPFVQAIALTDSVEGLTAQANDEGVETMFVTQLETMRLGSNDTVVGISSSGNSANVLEAIRYAKAEGATTIGMVGFDGHGDLATICPINVIVPQKYMEEVSHFTGYGAHEDAIPAVLHEQIEILRDRILYAQAAISSGQAQQIEQSSL